ncbi:MAG TPA: hypothetical protein VNU75_07480 [Acidimicrobiales bacterium]|nr:hypothetical protein [Acidimicrobiales bacterium]
MSPPGGPGVPAGRHEDPVAFLLEENGLVPPSAKGNGQRRYDRRPPQSDAPIGPGDGPAARSEAHAGSWSERVQRFHSIPKSLRTTASRKRVMGLTVVDQGFSSANNFALSFGIAHYSHANVLGVFAIVNTTWILTQGLIRSLTSDCLMTRHDTDEGVMAKYERAGYISAIACSSVMALLVLALSSVFSPELRLTFIIFAVSLPLLSAQDYSRYLGISRYNPAYAIGLDASWLFLSVVGYFVLRHAHLVSLPWLFASWSAAGAAVGVYTLWNHLGRRDLRQLIRFWFKSERGVGFRFAGQWLLVSSWTYAAIYIFIAIFSVAVIGQFKLAQLAFGPITVLSQGIVTSMVALAARYFQVDVSKALRFVLLAGAATAAVMLSWGALVYFLPVHAMTSALGPTWPAAHRMVPLMGLAFALTTLSGAFAAGLRSIRAAKENLRLSIVMIPVLFGCSVTAGILWGVIAAIAGICVGYGIYSVAAFAMLVHCARRITPSEIAVEDETDTVVPIEADNQNGALPAPVVFETVEPV